MARLLTSNPNIDQLRIQAKDLLRSHRAGDSSVCPTLRLLNRFINASVAEILGASLSLHEAQFALALDYGFSSWDALKKHVVAPPVVLHGWQRFSRDARHSVYLAQHAAKEEGATTVDLRHLLTGIAEDETEPGAQILRAISRLSPIDPAETVGFEDVNGEAELSAQATHAIDYTYEEATLIGDAFVGSQHLALGVLHALCDSSGDKESANQRLGIARELVRRQPKNDVQVKDAAIYLKELADAGGDPELQWVRHYTRSLLNKGARELIFQVASDWPSDLTDKYDGVSIRISGPAEGVGFMANSYRTNLGRLADYLAAMEVPDGEMRMTVIAEPDDPAHPEILMHLRFIEAGDVSPGTP